jgi:hypothetical protein
MFEKIKSAYTMRILKRDIREGTNYRQAGLDAQVKVIQNAKQKIIAELANIMKKLNDAHTKQGEFHVALASYSNSFFRLVRQEEAGLRELERMVTTGEGSSQSKSEGAKLQFNSIAQIDKYYSSRTRNLRKAAASLEQVVEKDEQYVMQHIFDIEYIRLLLAYFAYLTSMELKLRNTSNKLDKQEIKDIKAEKKDTEQVTEALKQEGKNA